MGCSGCGNRHIKSIDDVMGAYKYLSNRQINARLELYKKKYCKECEKKSVCDYEMYVKCKKNKE